ncbi:methyl-coenzyme M reductase operon protein D [Methanolobus sp.]|uniref:methyl-coenzyme M reductase operon protein D n=1 Tax=Methanolobus sp. TaxID=1874737 RepID=UPI0025F3A009|nr:methyl-coenzyme M reductase operon protein D [Methanolobus sp.]
MSDASTNADYLQLEIFPSRLLSPSRAETLLNEIALLEGVVRFFVHGPRVPQTVPYGPATGETVDHPANKVIMVAGQEVDLEVSVGGIRLEVTDADVKEDIREICDRLLPFSYEFREGLFIPTKQTVTDYAKRGSDADPMLIGMADPKGKLRNKPICILNKKSE